MVGSVSSRCGLERRGEQPVHEHLGDARALAVDHRLLLHDRRHGEDVAVAPVELLADARHLVAVGPADLVPDLVLVGDHAAEHLLGLARHLEVVAVGEQVALDRGAADALVAQECGIARDPLEVGALGHPGLGDEVEDLEHVLALGDGDRHGLGLDPFEQAVEDLLGRHVVAQDVVAGLHIGGDAALHGVEPEPQRLLDHVRLVQPLGDAGKAHARGDVDLDLGAGSGAPFVGIAQRPMHRVPRHQRQSRQRRSHDHQGDAKRPLRHSSGR